MPPGAAMRPTWKELCHCPWSLLPTGQPSRVWIAHADRLIRLRDTIRPAVGAMMAYNSRRSVWGNGTAKRSSSLSLVLAAPRSRYLTRKKRRRPGLAFQPSCFVPADTRRWRQRTACRNRQGTPLYPLQLRAGQERHPRSGSCPRWEPAPLPRPRRAISLFQNRRQAADQAIRRKALFLRFPFALHRGQCPAAFERDFRS